MLGALLVDILGETFLRWSTGVLFGYHFVHLAVFS